MTGLPAWAKAPAGVEVLRESTLQKNAHLVRCHHHREHRLKRYHAPGEVCLICKGDTATTRGFTWAVQMVVVLDAKLAPEPTQEALF